VDILVIMPARNQRDQAFKIHWAIQLPFPLHLVRPAEGDSAVGVACSGRIGRSHQGELRILLRSDTPKKGTSVDVSEAA